ncbi:MAG: BlaI/MecI/CopY family transcriptional regulator, partial [Alistipes sp.]
MDNVRNKPQELTRAELEIMQVFWVKGEVVIHDILDQMPEPKPAYNTVSTIVRILEKKGFVSHKAYGKTYEYYPLLSKEEYAKG